MSDTERTSQRPSCKFPIKEIKDGKPSNSTKSCGSEERIFNVKGSGKYTGRPRETPICGKHLPDAIRSWNYESAEPFRK